MDANGADLGAAEVAAGAALAAARGTRVLLFGPASGIGTVPEGVTLVDAPVSVAKEPEPALAVRSTPQASIVQAARAVAEGRADALVSGGSTGSAVAAGVFHIRRARGIHRPALAVPIPVRGGHVLLLDVGAGVEARPEHLVQFAFMGAAFARAVLGVGRPRVALLSNGAEAGRGTPAVISAHEQLAARARGVEGMRFTGNVEGTGIVGGEVDVVVTDGFTGNVALKTIEGVSQTVIGAVRDAATASVRGRVGGLLLRSGLRRFRDEIDPERAGGAYVLGLRRVGVVAHGRFTRTGFSQAIAVAERGVRERVVERTHAALEGAGFLRRASSEHPISVSAPS
ncbi:MAG: phosphate acyltransferase [Solirubrobacteraceae bacterium]